MKNLKFAQLSLLCVVIFSFALILIFVNYRADQKFIVKHKQLVSNYIYNLKKEQITDIVSSVHTAIKTTQKSGHILYSNLLTANIEQLAAKLTVTGNNNNCELLSNYVNANDQLLFRLANNKEVICQSKALPPELIAPDTSQYLLASKNLPDKQILTLLYKEQTVIDFVKKRVAKLVKSFKFENPDIYVWVNEIVNFSGGDKYAIRRIHPNLPESEGKYLSTNNKDIKGNLPYLTELNGLKAHGEVYFEYYFKRKTNDNIRQKLAYAKLYQPFNWAIVTGIYIDDIESAVNNEIDLIVDEINQHNNFLLLFLVLLSLLLIFLLYRLENNALRSKEKEVILKHKKQDIKNYQQIISSILDLVEKRDNYTAGHTKRVADYATAIAKAMHLPKKEIAILYEAAMMHDVGKISTPDAILLKPGKLSEPEYEIIQNHLDSGYSLLSSIEAFRPQAEVMRNHHERYDGKGYPRGMKGEKICISSRILILVDAFDAMTSRRIYKQSKTREQAINEIKSLSGKQFCPKVVAAAIPILETLPLEHIEHNYLSNEHEQARLAYYYKDPLTGLFNYKYLQHILSMNEQWSETQYHCCYLIKLANFGRYNKQHGWIAGDKRLIAIAKKLNQLLMDSLIFRVFGDDFLILSQQHIALTSEELTVQLNMADDILDLTIEHLDILEHSATGYEELTELVDTFVKGTKIDE